MHAIGTFSWEHHQIISPRCQVNWFGHGYSSIFSHRYRGLRVLSQLLLLTNDMSLSVSPITYPNLPFIFCSGSSVWSVNWPKEYIWPLSWSKAKVGHCMTCEAIPWEQFSHDSSEALLSHLIKMLRPFSLHLLTPSRDGSGSHQQGALGGALLPWVEIRINTWPVGLHWRPIVHIWHVFAFQFSYFLHYRNQSVPWTSYLVSSDCFHQIDWLKNFTG